MYICQGLAFYIAPSLHTVDLISLTPIFYIVLWSLFSSVVGYKHPVLTLHDQDHRKGGQEKRGGTFMTVLSWQCFQSLKSLASRFLDSGCFGGCLTCTQFALPRGNVPLGVLNYNQSKIAPRTRRVSANLQ